ncbi:carboxyl-terminal processing protease [Gillisia mitskevichiae]|uniref:Carboxyl-terminal processing protease n=1 Tax=Gillisia mitskevichiae TaxID=270921 RepID=A0A495PVA6_9FLAO|nr:carboxy terminal-processing peptidase [Gillisia mitskevichiae]RKS55082.1 carboxyl-terminal processing protease [Gillisia mitskevichiae]
MKRNYKFLVLVLLMAAASCSFTTKTFNDPNKDKLLIDLITYVLERGHYDAKSIDDGFSKEVYKDYLDAVDPLKRFFYEKDIEEFVVYQDKIDDQIRGKDLTFFNLTHDRLLERMKEVRGIYKEILAEPFDFSEDEEINTNYEEIDYISTRAELKERWRKQLKFSTLGNYYDSKEVQEKELEKDPSFKVKSDVELEKEARETILTSMDEYFDFSEELERKDYFTVYINAIVEEFDPHTFYFAPQDKDRFDIAMSGKLEGIGARLQKKSDNITIMEVISGGPAWLSDKLSEGDIILKVRQEKEKDPVSIVGMRLDDAVNLIKGPKDSKVTLTVKKKVMGNIEDVTITRDVVELEETYAKSALVNKEGREFGLINLPKFYFDMENYADRNAASDVEKEIIRLKKAGMEGLVLDLRNNGGGSLKTVVDIAGLFIEKGPVVQVKSKGVGQEILEDQDPSILWDGPLVILVNELSASASEILAAAMQDYKRAIIIGSKQTYGKGTVQNVIDLNQTVRSNEYGDLGALKLTTQKFYRVNGGSTQLEGVKSDVVVPDRYSYIDIGEKDYENPLPWDQIKAAKYKIWDGYIDFEDAIKNSNVRMSNNAQLNLIAENAKWVKEKRDEEIYPLNYTAYQNHRLLTEKDAKRFDAISDYTSNLTYESLPYEVELYTSDTILKEKRDRWHTSLTGDVYIEEAINVLEDIKVNNIKRSKVATIKN